MQTKFVIKRDDIENTPSFFIYSKMELYHTVRIDDKGKETFNGEVSEYMVRNGILGIPSDEVDLWISSVNEYINEHNQKVDDGNGFKIRFEIKSFDARSAYEYEEYVNDKKIRSGVSWGMNFDTQAETDAWMDAVIQYNKEHNITMPSFKIREKIDRIKEMINSLDSELPQQESYDLPLLSVALPQKTENPCDFVSAIRRAAESAIETIAGIPSPQNILNYNMKVAKNNIYTNVAYTADSQMKIVVDPVTSTGVEFAQDEEYWKELDAYYEQMAKEESDTVVLFDTVIEPPISQNPVGLTYDGTENDGTYDNNDYLPSDGEIPDIDYSNIPVAEYKEIKMKNIYAPNAGYGTASENTRAKRNVAEAMKNLWIPIRRAWEEYARNTLHINPNWIINSGYRPYKYNLHVNGSSKSSAHTYGYAIDVILEQFSSKGAPRRTGTRYLSGFIIAFLTKNRHIKFDQILIEYKGNSIDTAYTSWIHIGYKSTSGKCRRQICKNFNALNGGKGGKWETI